MADKVDDKEEHKRLTSLVKSVHAGLRKKFRANKGDHETVWHQHCQDQTLLSTYAECMQKLAQDHWTKNSTTRIDWCREAILEYFHGGGLQKTLEKDRKIQLHKVKKMQKELLCTPLTFSSAITSVNVTSQNEDANGCFQEYNKNASSSDNHIDEVVKIFDITCPLLDCASNRSFCAGVCGCDTSVNCMDVHSQAADATACSSEAVMPAVCVYNRTDREIRDLSERVSTSVHCDGQNDNVVSSIHEKGENADGDVSETTQGSGINSIYTEVQLPLRGKIRLLDVGSCYNPFVHFQEFQALGIDISPATETVSYCDFLHLETTEPLQLAPDSLSTYLGTLRSPIERLPRSSFHAVVFSLLLEYFPAPYQRWLCCVKAHQLLQEHGLLVIVTPDSHSQHRNAPMMRSWKTAIESMGFVRWRYIKQEHLHCMAFRKIPKPQGLSSGALVGEISPDLMYIPQDFSDGFVNSCDDLFSDDYADGCGDFSTSCGQDDFEDRENFFHQIMTELPGFVPDDCGEPKFFDTLSE